jgi:hypothetical protein
MWRKKEEFGVKEEAPIVRDFIPSAHGWVAASTLSASSKVSSDGSICVKSLFRNREYSLRVDASHAGCAVLTSHLVVQCGAAYHNINGRRDIGSAEQSRNELITMLSDGTLLCWPESLDGCS